MKGKYKITTKKDIEVDFDTLTPNQQMVYLDLKHNKPQLFRKLILDMKLKEYIQSEAREYVDRVELTFHMIQEQCIKEYGEEGAKKYEAMNRMLAGEIVRG